MSSDSTTMNANNTNTISPSQLRLNDRIGSPLQELTSPYNNHQSTNLQHQLTQHVQQQSSSDSPDGSPPNTYHHLHHQSLPRVQTTNPTNGDQTMNNQQIPLTPLGSHQHINVSDQHHQNLNQHYHHQALPVGTGYHIAAHTSPCSFDSVEPPAMNLPLKTVENITSGPKNAQQSCENGVAEGSNQPQQWAPLTPPWKHQNQIEWLNNLDPFF